MTDLFDKPLGDLKLPDYAAELNKAYGVLKPLPLPKASSMTQPSAIDAAYSSIFEKRAKELAKEEKKNGLAPAILIASVPSYVGDTTLPFADQSKKYTDFMNLHLTALKAANPKADELELEDAFKAKNPPPIDPTGGKGDIARGLAQYIPTTKGMLQGAAGLVLKKLGADETGDQLLQAAKKSYDEVNKLGLKNDSFTEALKPGGSLVDWAQFTVGSLAGNFLESIATGAVGAAIGGVVGEGVGAIPGGALGFVGKSLVKKEIKTAIEAGLEDIVKKQVAKGLTQEAAKAYAEKEIAKKLAKEAGKTAGQIGGLYAAATTRGAGEIVQQAQQAGLSPEEISAFDLATGAGLYALAETVSDKLMLGAFSNSSTRSLIPRVGLGVLKTALPEGATEVAQDAVVGLAAGTGLQSPEQAINAFAAGAVGGGAIGGGGAIISGQQAAPTPTPSPTDQLTATEDASPTRPAAGTITDLDGNGTMGVYAADGSLAYVQGQQPTPNADAVIAASRPVAPTAAPNGTIPGTTSMVAGASIIAGTDGTWAYNNGATPNPVADAELAMRNAAQPVAPTAAPVADTTAPAPAPELPEAVIDANDTLINDAVPLLEYANSRFEGLGLINAALARLSPADRQTLNAAAADTNATVTPQENPLLFAVRELGLNRTVENGVNERWADEVRAATPIQDVLNTMAGSGNIVGNTNAFIAASLIALNNATGQNIPSISYQQNPSQGELGSYNWGTHSLTFNRTTTANTVLHETVHSVTSRALAAYAADTSQQGRDVVAFLEAMLSQLRATGTTRGTVNVQEMFAELVRPEFLALAAGTRFDASLLSESARRGYELLGVQARSPTVLDVISRFIAYVLRKLDPNTPLDSASILAVLQTTAANLVSTNANLINNNIQPGSGPIATALRPTPAPAPAPVAQAPAPTATGPELPSLLATYPTSYRARSLIFTSNIDKALYIAYFSTEFGLVNQAKQYLNENGYTDLSIQSYRNDFITRLRDQVEEVSSGDSITVTPIQTNTPAQAAYTGPRLPEELRNRPAMYGGNPLSFISDIDRARFAMVFENIARPAGYRDFLIGYGYTDEYIEATSAAFQREINNLIRDLPRGQTVTVEPISSPNRPAVGPEFVSAPTPTPEPSIVDGLIADANAITSTPTPTTPALPPLAAALRNARPRYQSTELRFESAIDLAMMIALRANSRNHLQYRAFLNTYGYSDRQIENLRNTFNARLRNFVRTSGAGRVIPRLIAYSVEARDNANQLTLNYTNESTPTPAPTRTRAVSVPATTYTQPVFDALTRFASLRGARGIFRGVSPTGALGQLLPATATAQQRITHFWQAMRDGFAALPPNMRSLLVIDANNQIRAEGQRIYLSANQSDGTNVPTFSTGTTGFSDTSTFGSESTLGAAFYDILNGATISSRSRIQNNSLTPVNNYRLPINRLRAMLKWGALTNDFDNAVKLMATRGNATSTTAQTFTNQLALLARNAQEYLQPALQTGRIFYNAQTNQIEIGSNSYSLQELTPLTRSPAAPNTPERDQASAATPDAIAITGLANALQDAPDADARSAIIDAAFGDGENSLLTRVFALPDDEATVADTVFSLADQEIQAAENVVGPDIIPNQRINYTQLQEAVASGEEAAFVSPSSEIRQAARRRDWRGVLHGLSGTGKWLNQKLHDHLVPMVDWVNALPVPDALKASITAALYRAPGVRDYLLNDAMENYGGKELTRLLADFSTRYGISVETATRDAGYWATANRAPEGNAILLQRDADAIAEAQRTGVGVQAAFAQFTARHAAINNPVTRVKFHGGEGVAGFNNAQARLMLATLEAKYSRADMEAIAAQLQLLNAWRLATDIESGKTSPNTAIAFLRQPELLELLTELRDLGATTEATDAAASAALEAKRKEVITAVKSNYVPLSGNPNQAQTDSIFYSGGRQPNVSRDYRMQGRTTSIPDDAVSATLAAVIKSASYGGWRDFQDGIAGAYAAMTTQQREDVGIYRTAVSDRNAIPAGSIVRRRNGNTAAYHLRDAKLLEAVRGSNFEDNGNIFLHGMGKFTRLYSYLATQIAPWFAPKNFIRDFWDRSELVRTRKYLDSNGVEVDSTKVAQKMLSYMGNPAKLAMLMKATQKHAFAIDGSKSLEARYLDELLRLGGGSIFGDRFTANRADLVEAILKEKNGLKQVAKLKEYVAKYNRMFDLGPSLAAFIALRESGVPADRAAGGALDLMNFRKRGENSAILSSFYAFAQPSITSGVNTFASLGTRRGQIRLAAYTVALMGLQGFLRSLADDDEGGNKLDQQSDFLQNTHILVPFGNGIIKIPLAFGIARIANSMARNAIGLGTGNLTPVEAGSDLMSGGIVPVISPIEDINVPWNTHPVQAFGLTFAPTWLKPLLAVGFNQTPWGTAVTNDKYEDTAQYKSEQFGKGVSPTYKEIAIFMRESIGADMSPEDVKYLINGYPLGPGTMLVNGFIDNPYAKSKGRKVDDPITQQVYAGFSQAAIYFQHKEALAKTDALLKEVNVGNTSFSAEDQAALDWRKRWDKTDDALNAAKSKVTKDKTLSETGKISRKDAIQKTREQATALSLYQYRTAIGLPATRVETWSPK